MSTIGYAMAYYCWIRKHPMFIAHIAANYRHTRSVTYFLLFKVMSPPHRRT